MHIVSKASAVRTALVAVYFLFALLLLGLSSQMAHAQSLLIEGARIVPGNGPVIESGTVLVQDGKIVSVVNLNTPQSLGTPANVQVIDGKGLTVYPGLMDAYCLAGVSAPPSAPAATNTNAGGGQRRQGGGNRPGGGNAAPPPAAPLVWRKATEGLDVKTSAFAALRNTGYTNACLGTRGTLTPGEDVLLALSPGERPATFQDRAAINLNMLSRGFNTYPSTLMGAFAFLRQALYDGMDYNNQPHAKSDARLEGLGLAAQGKLPVFVAASSENDIKRALRLADEFHLRLLVLGGKESEKVAARLAAQKATVVLTDDWSPAPALHKAGVPFALASGTIGLDSGDVDKMRERLLELVEKGLPAEVALAALTRVPAEALGMGEKLGTVAPGKQANLVVTEGDLFNKGAKIRFLVVNGQKVEPTPVKADAGPRLLRVASDGIPYGRGQGITEEELDGDGGGDR